MLISKHAYTPSHGMKYNVLQKSQYSDFGTTRHKVVSTFCNEFVSKRCTLS